MVITPALKDADSYLLLIAPPGSSLHVEEQPAVPVGSPPDSNPNTDFYWKRPPTRPLPRGLGGSVAADVLGIETTALPEIDYGWVKRACVFVREAIRRRLVSAARDVSDGGPLVAIAEMAFAAADRGKPVGFRIDLWFRSNDLVENAFQLAREAVWHFDEMPGFVLEVSDAAHGELRELANAHGIFSTGPLGYTIAEPRAEVRSEDGELVESVSIAELREAWEAPLRDFYGAAVGPGPSPGSGPSRGSRPSTGSG
jgi:hypothetical protein